MYKITYLPKIISTRIKKIKFFNFIEKQKQILIFFMHVNITNI